MAKTRSLTIAFLVLLTIALAQSGFAAMKMTPLLEAVTTTSAYAVVECDSREPVQVDYGPATAYGLSAATEIVSETSASPVTYVHKIKMTGLEPDTTYHYKVSQGIGSTEDHTFGTAVNPSASYRFDFMADCRTGTAVHDRISERIRAAHPRFSLYGGDMCINGSYKRFKSEWFRVSELALDAAVPFFLAPGNHEGWSTNARAFTVAPESASGTQDYYSFDYGDVHFVSVNNQVPYTSGSPQYKFVAEDLKNTKRTWKVVFNHNPAYCSGGHGDDAGMKAMTTNIFEPNHVDMALSGHSHFFQHNLVNGIHHVVIGSSGAQLYDPKPAPYTVKTAKSYCYGIIDVTPRKLRLVVYSDSGAVLDTLDLSK